MRTHTILLSVIIPVYNAEKYLEQCLDSVLGQTYENLEIIVVDDGSSDKSSEICDLYAKGDSRIRVIHRRNGGLVSARKAGLEVASGKYCTYVDADDWLDIDTYEKMMHIICRNNIDIICFGEVREYTGFNVKRRELVCEGLYTRAEFLQAARILIKEKGWFCRIILAHLKTKIVKTELIRYGQNMVDDRIVNGEDTVACLACLFKADNIYISSDCLYHYRIRFDSMSHTKNDKIHANYLLMAYKLIELWKMQDKLQKIDRLWLVHLLYFHLAYLEPKYLWGNKGNLMCFPEIKSGQNIIIYGKGRFARELIQYINKERYCRIIDNIDKTDITKILQICPSSYDWIVIAIIDCEDVEKSVKLLSDLNVANDKICCANKMQLTIDGLPEEVQMRINDL